MLGVRGSTAALRLQHRILGGHQQRSIRAAQTAARKSAKVDNTLAELEAEKAEDAVGTCVRQSEPACDLQI